MKNLNSYTKTILKLVRESLAGLNIPSPASNSNSQPSSLYNPNPSPFVNVGDETVMTFTYGLSEYGGEDIVMNTDATRTSKRYFLQVSGD